MARIFVRLRQKVIVYNVWKKSVPKTTLEVRKTASISVWIVIRPVRKIDDGCSEIIFQMLATLRALR